MPLMTLTRILLLSFSLPACASETPTETGPDASPIIDAGVEPARATAPGVEPARATAPGVEPAVSPPCAALFGSPNERTGLSAEQCSNSCRCGGQDFEALTYDAAFATRLRSYELHPPLDELLSDPYATPAPPAEIGERVCAVVIDLETPLIYALETFDSEAHALAAGARPTHFGPCGLCSTLADLAVYATMPDLTQPVRTCGVKGLTEGDAANLDCLLELGFTRPCAQIWSYNTRHTREQCLATCLALLDAPYHRPDGALNDCLACDEEKSGPVFKAVAGRTRRNSGLANTICRPCAEARPINHDYKAR